MVAAMPFTSVPILSLLTMTFSPSSSICLNMKNYSYDEIGLNWGYYPILPTQIIIGRKRHYTISVQTNFFRSYDSKGCIKRDDYSYPECVVDWARKRYVEMFEENNRTGGLTLKLDFTLSQFLVSNPYLP